MIAIVEQNFLKLDKVTNQFIINNELQVTISSSTIMLFNITIIELIPVRFFIEFTKSVDYYLYVFCHVMLSVN